MDECVGGSEAEGRDPFSNGAFQKSLLLLVGNA